MVAEKPSIAQTLADALSPNRKYSTRSGVSWFILVHSEVVLNVNVYIVITIITYKPCVSLCNVMPPFAIGSIFPGPRCHLLAKFMNMRVTSMASARGSRSPAVQVRGSFWINNLGCRSMVGLCENKGEVGCTEVISSMHCMHFLNLLDPKVTSTPLTSLLSTTTGTESNL